jgi:hypothetical protein
LRSTRSLIHPRDRIGLGVECCPEGVLLVQTSQQLACPCDEHRCEFGVQLTAGASAYLLDSRLVPPILGTEERSLRRA